MEERRKQDRRQDCQTCEEHPFRIKEFKNEIGNLVRKITTICERLEKLETTSFEKWKEHLQFADDSLKDQRIWKREVEQEQANIRLLIESIKRTLEIEMKRIELDHTKEVDNVKVNFIEKINSIKTLTQRSVIAILGSIIVGIIINIVVLKLNS